MTFSLRVAPSFAVCLWLLAALGVRGSDWPQWRGPFRNGHVPPGERVPDQLPIEPKVVWKLKVGEGLASPVVAQSKVVYCDAQNGVETVHALDASSASELWRVAIGETFSDTQGPAGPRCTPLVDGDRVYAVSCRGELRCLKLADGAAVWGVSFTKDFGAVFIGEKGNATGATRHGNDGSPLIVGDHLIACVGDIHGAGVVCFEKRTGKVVWKSQNDRAGYAPPILAGISGVDQIVCFTVEGLIGLGPEDGQLLWRRPLRTSLGRHVTTPVAVDDVVVVGSHQLGLVGTRVMRAGSEWKAEPAWLSKDLAINFASPIVVGNYLYGLGPNKDLFCLEVPSGKLMWSKQGYFTTPAGKAHAAFIAMGKLILILTDGGELLLIEANPSAFKEVSRVQVCGMNWCNPAYADGKLYLRDGVKKTGELFCVGLTR